ncbi:DUF3558 family protein [Nocardia brasiliensis]|uniref:Lipoprotein n=1 Tax=Nocardia brasiliensis (strain ATCC 700358 / HUJEG-1) TaxID=1133849 RepID=K0EQ77_NOCB7|nr:DUF3558 family protein [Nocardia brasiliensis]AFU01888.1 lipoprotein [Nocardia brasiliensis ATCC 700358]OCF89352.1 hypothetical protein AW168_17135 [Nocardia brasiliensis]
MKPFAARIAGLAALAGVLAACGTPPPDAAPAVAAHPYADCAPVTTDQIRDAVRATALLAHHTPQACLWDAQIGDGDAGVSFTFSARDSLQQIWDRARADGFETEHMVITKHVLGTVTATAFYIRNPHDPGDCAVAAAANGAIVWRIQNRTHSTQLNPCAAALQLATLMVDLSP